MLPSSVSVTLTLALASSWRDELLLCWGGVRAWVGVCVVSLSLSEKEWTNQQLQAFGAALFGGQMERRLSKLVPLLHERQLMPENYLQALLLSAVRRNVQRRISAGISRCGLRDV